MDRKPTWSPKFQRAAENTREILQRSPEALSSRPLTAEGRSEFRKIERPTLHQLLTSMNYSFKELVPVPTETAFSIERYVRNQSYQGVAIIPAIEVPEVWAENDQVLGNRNPAGWFAVYAKPR